MAVEPRFADEALLADERPLDADLVRPDDVLLALEVRLVDELRRVVPPRAAEVLRRPDEALLVVDPAPEDLPRPEAVRRLDPEPLDALRFLLSAATRVAAASARSPAALAAVFAVPAADLAASATRLAVFLAELLACAWLRLAVERLRVAAALVPAACRCALVCLAISPPVP